MAPVKLGLHLPTAGAGASAEAILDVARSAERLGFDSVWMFDHLMTPTGLESKYPYSRDGSYPMDPAAPFFDPVGLFGVLAAATERVRLGTSVLIPAYRHPIVLGKILATIAAFAPGRIVLGVGAGWMREEFDAVGVDPEGRGRRLDEYITALSHIWSPEPQAFEGEFYSWEESSFLPAPAQPIPLIVGGHGDASVRRAARLGDGWAAVTGKGQGSGLDALGQRVDFYKQACEDASRDPDSMEIVYTTPLWFSDSPHPKMPLTGPADAIGDGLRRLGDIGITTVDLAVFGPSTLVIEAAERFTEEVAAKL